MVLAYQRAVTEPDNAEAALSVGCSATRRLVCTCSVQLAQWLKRRASKPLTSALISAGLPST